MIKNSVKEIYFSLITTKASSAALPSVAPPCGVLAHTPQASLLGALHLTPCW